MNLLFKFGLNIAIFKWIYSTKIFKKLLFSQIEDTFFKNVTDLQDKL